eukprot:3315869-Rhodomonas_salina.2
MTCLRASHRVREAGVGGRKALQEVWHVTYCPGVLQPSVLWLVLMTGMLLPGDDAAGAARLGSDAVGSYTAAMRCPAMT